ncbi:toxin-antitoxin system HicB family antitoxin [Amycolatopsis sp. FBCC-B4732]|uniref:FitA-like ribbon-helix-helix domain-containing protein n=1 Tax=Amycolatopsis sp. FBCC-B4732 TaxID=3079339 RepID=UPI001FF5181A|nr:toxin-antitoxin system HicB family antitoxin [Amycolatopsis sp. FBCC-B4732]UOX88613.1 toxin-antitoxin system HicB family antitoxin [Amycolatopsis sp. FBCC-B4732]
MKQLITRIDDELHTRLKAKAEAEGRSMNELVTELLRGAVAKTETRAEWKQRLVAEGKLITFEPEGEPPGHDELEELSRGWGTAVSEALDWTRGEQ